jgi:hypothetical protein
MKTVLLSFALLSFSLATSAETFQDGNSPGFFKKISGTDLIFQFKQLPMNGEQLDSRYGWSETYWPSN